ncbi:hypothetical protein [Methylorubrum thiocyanatum]|uniref:hypothetical protein n=1 Tax=Methylorubrum thiocyanatum TaxID=47958 RepID=UPI0035C7F06B
MVNKMRAWIGLCHFANVHQATQELERFLPRARGAADLDDVVEFMIGGGSNTVPGTSEEVNQAREAALASVRPDERADRTPHQASRQPLARLQQVHPAGPLYLGCHFLAGRPLRRLAWLSGDRTKVVLVRPAHG